MQRLMSKEDKGATPRDAPDDRSSARRSLLSPPLRNRSACTNRRIWETVSPSDAPVTLDKECATERDNTTRRGRGRSALDSREAAAELNPVMGREPRDRRAAEVVGLSLQIHLEPAGGAGWDR